MLLYKVHCKRFFVISKYTQILSTYIYLPCMIVLYSCEVHGKCQLKTTSMSLPTPDIM